LGSFLSSLRKNIGFLPPGTRLLRCRSEAYRFTWVKSFKESRYSSQRVRVPAEFPQTRRRTITSGPGRIASEKESSGTKNASNRSRVPIAPGEKRACSGQHVSSMAAGGPRLTKSAGAGLHHELDIGIGSAIQRGPDQGVPERLPTGRSLPHELAPLP